MTALVEKIANAICRVQIDDDDLYDQARAALAAIDAEGLVIVPKKPTPAMLEAAQEHDSPNLHWLAYGEIYRAMIAAAVLP